MSARTEVGAPQQLMQMIEATDSVVSARARTSGQSLNKTIQGTSKTLLVLCATCLFSFSGGLLLAFPSVLNPAILAANSTDINATPDQVSWIAACHGISGFVGFAILSPIFQLLGRKTVNILLNVIVLVGWVIFYFAYSVTSLVLARLVQGLAVGGVFIVAVNLSENSLPSRRGYFMSIKKVSLAFGSLACHSLGFPWSWRKISLFAIFVQFIATIILLPCPESPAYLAMVGKYEECKKSYRWLFGESVETEKGLREMIAARMEKREEKKTKACYQIKETAMILLKKDFQKPFFIVVLATLAVDACGRYFMLAYITQIMIEITGNKSVSMYCSIAGDCLLIIALSFSCFMVKRFKRRTLIFRLGFASAFLMFAVSATVMLRSFSLISGMRWLTPCFVLIHSFVAHIGLVPVTFAILCEIFPLEYKGMGSFTTGVVFTIFYTLTLKLTPLMIINTGIEGTYAIYGLCVAICLGVLFFILPETKDRTLQDIEDEIRGVKRGVDDEHVKSVLINDK